MTRPEVVVNISAAQQRRGAPSDTGTAMIAFSGATSGPTTPQKVTSAAEVATLYGTSAASTALATQVGDVLAEGAPRAVLVRCTGATATLTDAEWTTGLNQLLDEYGATAQVAIPGVTTAAAATALMNHAAAKPSRTVFIDAADNADVATLKTLALAQKDLAGSPRSGLLNAVSMDAGGGATRVMPGSIAAMALAARGDAAVGHTNHQPAGDQLRGAGVLKTALAPVRTFTDAELSELHDAGVSVIRQINGRPTLYGWRSLSADARWKQLNWGRFTAELTATFRSALEPHLFCNLDASGAFYDEIANVLTGHLLRLQSAGAIYGTDTKPGFSVAVREVNNAATVAAGQLRAAGEITYAGAAERVVFDVTTYRAGA